MKNYNECLRMDIKSPTGSSASSIASSKTDIKIKDRKVYDTSSSADAFSGLSAGDTIKMTGWEQDENNGIMDVVEVESAGEWFTVTAALINVAEADTPSAGITVQKAGEKITVNSDMTKYDEINDVVNLNGSASSPADMTKANFGITNDGTVACFETVESDDQLLFLWSDMSAG